MTVLRVVTGLLHLFLGVWVWYVSSKYTSSQKWFTIFSSAIALWLFSAAALFNSFSSFNLQITYTLGTWVGITAVIWVIYFTRKRLAGKLFFSILIVGIFFSALCLTPNAVVIGMHRVADGLYAIDIGAYYYVFIAFIAVVVGVILWLLISSFLSAKGVFREQIRYVLLGAIIFGGEIFLSNALFPFVGLKMISIIDGISPLIFAGISAYAMVRYRFMDIKFVFRKGTVYATTLAIVIGLYSYLVFVISQTTSNVFKIGGDVTSVAIIILITLGFHPLKKIVEHTLNGYIFPKRVDLRAAAKRITLQLSTSITEIEKIIKAIRDEARPALGVESMDLFFQKEPGVWGAVMPVSNSKITVDPKDPLFQRFSQKSNIIIAEELEYLINDAANPEDIKSLEEVRKILLANGAAAVVPIVQHPDTIIGILILGPKANQSAYTVEDIQFLRNLQQNLPLSLSGIILYYQAMKRVHMQIKK